MSRRVLAYGLVLVLAGCGTSPVDRSKTVASLDERPLPEVEASRLQVTTEDTEQLYRQFLTSDEASPALRAEATRRLADLQLESEEGSGKAIEQAEPTVDQVIALYEGLLRDYPDYPRNDRVLYQLARAYDYAGRREDALETLNRYAREYPEGERYAEVAFRRGEILFVEQRFEDAVGAYSAVLERGEDSGFYSPALYKKGWALYKLNRYEQALGPFFDLVAHTTDNGRLAPEEISGASGKRLDDTLRAAALSFSVLGGPEAIQAYFSEHGGRAFEALIYERLGEHYRAQERWTDAATIFRNFAEAHPMHERAPLFKAQIIKTYEQGGFPSKVLEAKAELIEAYGRDTPYWAERDPADHPKVSSLLQANLAELARHHHARAQTRDSAAEYEAAAGYYRRYIDWFPDAEDTPRMHFLLAELLFERQRYAAATEAFEATAYRYDAHEQAAEAGHSALLAYERRAEQIQGQALNQWLAQKTASALRFGESFPDHPEAPKALLGAAKTLYAQKDYLRTLSAIETLLTRYDTLPRETRRAALRLRGHAAFDKEHYELAEEAYRQALALYPESGVSRAQRKQRREITENYAAAVYKQGESLREAGELAKAAEYFRRVGDIAPGTDIHATAQYDAAAALLAMEQWSRAATVLERFKEAFPNHELHSEATRRLAVAYANSDQGGSAAVAFEQLGSAADAPPEQRRQALMQAAQLYEDAGELAKAASALTTLVETFARPVESRVEAMHRLAGIYGKLNEPSNQRRWQRAIVRAHESAGSAATDRTRYLAAHASMDLAQDLFDAYSSVELTAPLQRSLKRKKSLMEETLDAYERAADYGVADVTTSATYHIAAVYYDLSRALLDSERPSDLNDMELEQYNMLLEDRAFPFEEKAIKIHETNAGRVTDGIYDEWIRKSFQQLAKLFPARYAKTERNGNVAQSPR